MGNIVAAEGKAAPGLLFQAGKGVGELGLTVAFDTGDANDLAGANIEGYVLHGVVFMQFGRHGDMLNVQYNISGLPVGLFHRKLHRTAHHHPGKLLPGGVPDVHGADALAAAQHCDTVGDVHDFLKLVGDEQYAFALAGEAAHDLHELLYFLRGQHGGGLVENEYLVVAVEHFQNLDALLHADGDVLNPGVHVDVQAVFLRQGDDLFPGLLFPEEAELIRLHAQDDVVQNGKHLHQLEVLMHHADAQVSGVIGIVYPDLHAVFPDNARLRLIQAEQHAHERGLTGAVFAQQGVDLASPELEANVVVGLDARKFLGNIEHFDYEIFSQTHHSRLLNKCEIHAFPII